MIPEETAQHSTGADIFVEASLGWRKRTSLASDADECERNWSMCADLTAFLERVSRDTSSSAAASPDRLGRRYPSHASTPWFDNAENSTANRDFVTQGDRGAQADDHACQ